MSKGSEASSACPTCASGQEQDDQADAEPKVCLGGGDSGLLLGFRVYYSPIMENQMENKMENEMETGRSIGI